MKVKNLAAALLAFSSAVLLITGGCGLKSSPTSYGQDPAVSTSPTSSPTSTSTPTPIVPTPTPTPVTLIAVNTTNFTQQVLNCPIPVMVVCGASWCGWCTLFDPIAQQFADDYNGKIKVVMLDCTNGSPIANTYGVTGYPTSLFFKKGALKATIGGYVLEPSLISTFNSL
jgi:thioredoxin 1